MHHSRSPAKATTSFSSCTIVFLLQGVKLRLPDSTSHQTLSNLLSPYHTKTHLQQNIFFDTPSLTLATTHRAALRLRFYDIDSQDILLLKAKPVISDGMCRIEEEEEPLDPSLTWACVAETWRTPNF
ncbi:hypothetical protein L2E82_32868 [Cichorium intybus]|uniref:Uncharacterized protein n=1 Tax=Cichorium intybus TaxID=13427 RepID=A0ACB9BHL6_CICIN|nr:hypothetical protein L2E82_32868 [Cichorium intybus]